VAWKEVGDGTCNSPDIRNRVGLINKRGNYTSNNLNNLSKVNINFIVFKNTDLIAETKRISKRNWITGIDDSSNCESHRPKFVKRLKLV
jgi:hypothetical protein